VIAAQSIGAVLASPPLRLVNFVDCIPVHHSLLHACQSVTDFKRLEKSV